MKNNIEITHKYAIKK